MKSMYVCGAWMRLRVYISVQAMYGAGNALYWNDSERQNSMHLTLLKYPNTKTSLYKLSKNHWVIAFFKNFGSVRKKLQFTVLLDHPVVYGFQMGYFGGAIHHTSQILERLWSHIFHMGVPKSFGDNGDKKAEEDCFHHNPCLIDVVDFPPLEHEECPGQGMLQYVSVLRCHVF